MKAINTSLKSFHVLTVVKCLELLYNNFDIFQGEFKLLICDYLMGNIFFDLFMHWNYNIRLFFHHLIIYRIYHPHRNK